MLFDTFWDYLPGLQADGWVFTSINRYDPTTLAGLTPTGKAFTASLAGDVVTVTVAGTTRTSAILKDSWLPGDATAQAIRSTYAKLPANQR